jgi:large subunit ribosomal protein L10
MNKEDKSLLVNELAQSIADYSHFYVVDAGDMDAGKTKVTLEDFALSKRLK